MANSRRLLEGVRVLLVEDHVDTLVMYEEVLTNFGAVVTTSTSARDAAEHLTTVDVIVTDIAMPADEDGIWLLEAAQRTRPSLPVIGISGYTREQLPRIAKAQFDVLLLKPADPWGLVDEIAMLLGRLRP
jgi:CheY-like chemotaxis protein